MNIEPDLKLALALHNSPGVYALLLGSGLSSAAGIPTGWQVVLDLIRKLAAARNVELPDDAAAEKWYSETYQTEPDYSDLLDALTSTSDERQQLLRSYFEPTEEEREDGKKMPTEAHRTIARMVRNENIRMILTTNFDRLLEQALQDEGVQPDVISSVDGLNGALPYVHSKVFVVKLHGDYRDPRLLNTEAELSAYPDQLNRFLDEVLDRFGLVVCGWSGTWDIALREAILRAPNRRFTTFWLSRGTPSEDAQAAIEQRHAETIAIESADDVFMTLDAKLKSLRDLSGPHPMSVEVAVATVKRYLVEDRHRIRLHDLFMREVEEAHSANLALPTRLHGVSQRDAYQQRLQEAEGLVEKLARMTSTLAYFGSAENSTLITRCIERLLQLPIEGGSSDLLHLKEYPALLVMYSAGIAAIAVEGYSSLAAALLDPEFRHRDAQETVHVSQWIAPVYVLGSSLLGNDTFARRHTPHSDYVLSVVERTLKTLIPEKNDRDACFDIFEYLLALCHWDVAHDTRYVPYGAFFWRYNRQRENAVDRFMTAGTAKGAQWGLLEAGFFGGNPERLAQAIASLQPEIDRLKSRFR